MQNSGTKVDCSELRNQLFQLRAKESTSEGPSAGNSLKIGFHYPKSSSNHHHSQPPTQRGLQTEPNFKPQLTELQQSKPKEWASLFQAQGRSTIMKLSHYPELQQGDDPVVELEDSHINDRSWNNCLIGHFLDGKMAFLLLSSTARKIWKDHGRIKIKQVGACYFFEFQDEGTKSRVLEGGPYFFSRKYLVLKDWHRMLVPSTDHPSTIPAWIKIHKLPLECWTQEGLSRITSTIGKTLHVDIATAQQQRLDFARVCVEVSANSDLPKTIQIRHGLESVTVFIEHQWLPPRFSKCKVFGYDCKPKVEEQITNNDETWKQIGKALGGGGGVLEALTKEVPNAPIGAAFVIQPEKEGMVIEDLGDGSQSETAEELSDPINTSTSSCTTPPLVNQAPQPTVVAVCEQDQMDHGLPKLDGKGSLENERGILPDPPDAYRIGRSAKKNKQKNNKKANSGSKGVLLSILTKAGNPLPYSF